MISNVSRRGHSRSLLMSKKHRNDTRTYLRKQKSKLNTMGQKNQDMRDQLDAEGRQAQLVDEDNTRQIQ